MSIGVKFPEQKLAVRDTQTIAKFNLPKINNIWLSYLWSRTGGIFTTGTGEAKVRVARAGFCDWNPAQRPSHSED